MTRPRYKLPLTFPDRSDLTRRVESLGVRMARPIGSLGSIPTHATKTQDPATDVLVERIDPVSPGRQGRAVRPGRETDRATLAPIVHSREALRAALAAWHDGRDGFPDVRGVFRAPPGDLRVIIDSGDIPPGETFRAFCARLRRDLGLIHGTDPEAQRKAARERADTIATLLRTPRMLRAWIFPAGSTERSRRLASPSDRPDPNNGPRSAGTIGRWPSPDFRDPK